MPKQRALDLHGEGRLALWERLPDHCRREAIAILARLIGRAAQSKTQTSEKGNEK